MAYGNILTVYNSNEAILDAVKTILNGLPFRKLESTFFLQTQDRQQTRDIVGKLIAASVVFTFYYIDDFNGDALPFAGIDTQLIQDIKHILLLI